MLRVEPVRRLPQQTTRIGGGLLLVDAGRLEGFDDVIVETPAPNDLAPAWFPEAAARQFARRLERVCETREERGWRRWTPGPSPPKPRHSHPNETFPLLPLNPAGVLLAFWVISNAAEENLVPFFPQLCRIVALMNLCQGSLGSRAVLEFDHNRGHIHPRAGGQAPGRQSLCRWETLDAARRSVSRRTGQAT